MVRVIIFCLCVSLLWADYVPNQVLVKLKESSTPKIQSVETSFSPKLKNLLDSQGAASISKAFESSKNSSGIRSMSVNPAASVLDRYYLVEYPAPINVELLVEMLKADPAIELAEPVYIYKTMVETIVTPNDPLYAASQNYLEQISAPAGWAICTGNADVIVAVIDTGVRTDHEDLAGKLIAGWNFVEKTNVLKDDNGHGTHVTGLIAANTDNGTGIAGLGWNVRVMPIRSMKDKGGGLAEGTVIDIVSGIHYAINNGAQVINMSLGGSSYSQAFAEACADAYARNIVLVAAAGNDGDNWINYPAGFSTVIGVGSVNSKNNKSDFSNYNSAVEVTAPGGDNLSSQPYEYIRSTWADGSYYDAMGTSQATPLVSGLCALLKSQNSGLANYEIRTILHNTADDYGSTGWDDYFGFGVINVYKALARVTTAVYRSSRLEDILSFPNPASTAARFSFKIDKPVELVEIIIYDQRGRKLTTLEHGSGMAGIYATPEWDLKVNGKNIANGSYVYVLKVTNSDGSTSYGRNILTIVR